VLGGRWGFDRMNGINGMQRSEGQKFECGIVIGFGFVGIKIKIKIKIKNLETDLAGPGRKGVVAEFMQNVMLWACGPGMFLV